MAEAILPVDRYFVEAIPSASGEWLLLLSEGPFVHGRNPKDVDGVPSDVIVLKSTGPTTKEWYEGFEELGSIPHAFALVFTNGEPPIMFFSDSAPEKVCALIVCAYFIADSLASGLTLRPFNDMSMIV